LRAKRSNPRCRARKNGLLRRFAPRNDGAPISRYTSAFPRRVSPGALQIVSPAKERGRRESRMRAAPAVSCANMHKNTHTSIQVQRRTSGLPCAVVLRLITRSPRRPALLPPSLRKYSAKLDASIGASGPHDFAVRISHARQSQHLRPSHPTARFVTIASRPSSWVRRAELCP
jgi:hypothetical protein